MVGMFKEPTSHISGTSSIVDEVSHEPRLSTLAVIAETAVKLRREGHKVVLVSSGAIGVALRRMDLERRPKNLSKLQVFAILQSHSITSLSPIFKGLT